MRDCNIKCPHQTAGLCNFKTTEGCERKAKAEQSRKQKNKQKQLNGNVNLKK